MAVVKVVYRRRSLERDNKRDDKPCGGHSLRLCLWLEYKKRRRKEDGSGWFDGGQNCLGFVVCGSVASTAL